MHRPYETILALAAVAVIVGPSIAAVGASGVDGGHTSGCAIGEFDRWN